MASGMTYVLKAVDQSVSKTIGHIGKELDSTAKKSSGFGKFAKKGGALAATGLAAAAAAAGAFAVSAVKAGAQDEQAQALLARTLRNSTKARKQDIASVEDWISKTTLATGVADDHLRPALGQLVRATGSTTKAQKLLKTSMDISAATGKPLESVSLALSKAYNGNTGALGRLGINMKDAKGKALPFKDAMKRVNDQFGGAQAAKTKTFSGQVQVLSNRFQETKESIGQALIPVLTKLFGWVNDKLIPAIGAFWGWIKKAAAAIGEKLAPHVQKVRDALADAKPQIDTVLNVLKEVGKFIITKLLPIWVKWQGFLVGKLIDAIALVIKYGKFLIDAYVAVYDFLKSLASKILRYFIAPVVNGFLWLAEQIVGAAATAFGWVPGIGDKLKSARDAIHNFRESTNRTLDGWAAALEGTGERAGRNLTKGLRKGLRSSGASRSAINAAVHINVPNLASGGIVRARHGGTLVNVAEAGRDEAIVPLRGTGADIGSRELHVHVHTPAVVTNDRQLADLIRRATKSAALVGAN